MTKTVFFYEMVRHMNARSSHRHHFQPKSMKRENTETQTTKTTKTNTLYKMGNLKKIIASSSLE